MLASSPILTLYLILISIVFLLMLGMIHLSGLTTISHWVFIGLSIIPGFILLWWPIDLIINWDKQTPASANKDRILACISIGVILFIFPYFFIGTPYYPTLLAAIAGGLVIPGLYAVVKTMSFRQPIISPGLVQKAAVATDKVIAFNTRFPHAHQYVLGYEGGSNKQAYYVLHERQEYERFENAYIDYVLSVPVDRKKGVCIEGMEKLECYLFINAGNKAGVAFLTSANFGRTLDVGYTDDEVDGAVEEAKQFKQVWRPIEFEPIAVQHFKGKSIRMK